MKYYKSLSALCAALLLAVTLLVAALFPANVSAASRFTVSVSSSLADENYSADYLTDGNMESSWFAQWLNVENPSCDEYIILDFGEVCKVNNITLFRHKDGTSFPVDFSFGWSERGELYEEIPGFSLTGYTPAGGNVGEEFRIRTVARYVKIRITKRSPNPDGNYMLALAEIEAGVTAATDEEIKEATNKDAAFERTPVVDDPVIEAEASASSENRPKEDWGVANINDGSPSTQWCAEWGSGVDEEACDEWIVLAFKSPQYVTGVIIESQTAEYYGFPKNFSFEWTLDGENFFAVEGASYENEGTAERIHVKEFDAAVVATVVRFNITSSYEDTQGNFIPQLAELNAHGWAATDAEIDAATEQFNKLHGESQKMEAKVYESGYGTVAAVFLACGIVLFGAAAVLLLTLVGKTRRAATKQGGDDTHEA